MCKLWLYKNIILNELGVLSRRPTTSARTIVSSSITASAVRKRKRPYNKAIARIKNRSCPRPGRPSSIQNINNSSEDDDVDDDDDDYDSDDDRPLITSVRPNNNNGN